MKVLSQKISESLVLLIFVILVSVLPVHSVWSQVHPHRETVLLAVNDVYRIQGVDDGQQGGLALVRALRRQLELANPDLLFLHAGDFLFPSLLSEWDEGAHMIEVMNALDGDSGVPDQRMFVVFGNHEFEKGTKQGASLLQARIDESEFRWLNANIRFSQEGEKSLVSSEKLQRSSMIESGGIRIGIFGLTTDRKSAKEIAYVDELIDPVGIAREQTKQLRGQGAEVVIALTHLTLHKDREILEVLGETGPDLIIGGHEHHRHHVEVEGRWILKADADARTATVVRIHMIGEKPFISFGYRFLNRRELTPDLSMERMVDRIVAEHDMWFCSTHHEEKGCLQRDIGTTTVPLNGKELEIRRYETNLGNWVADQMRAIVPHADMALINAGALRVNQTIPPGPISRRHIEELFNYDSELVVSEIPSEQLDAVLERAAKDWVGQGHWLQVSGLAFKHHPQNPEGQRIDNLHLFNNGQLKPLPDRPLGVVATKFLSEGGDGYEMLKGLRWISVKASLKNWIGEILAIHEGPIHPSVDGRICNTLEFSIRSCAFNMVVVP